MRAAIHELRNHLSVAMCGIEAFLDRKLEPTDARFRSVLQALHAVDRIIDDLPRDRTVAFGMHLEWIDVCSLVATHVSAIEGYAAERGVGLTTHACEMTHAPCARFMGDPVRIAEIVTNVLLNAINYSPRGATVRVDCRRHENQMQFSVCDAGPGIGRDDRAHIFERGYRGSTERSVPGSGIGLALVKEFVDGQGGTIDVADAPLGGTMFVVSLPGTLGESFCVDCGA